MPINKQNREIACSSGILCAEYGLPDPIASNLFTASDFPWWSTTRQCSLDFFSFPRAIPMGIHPVMRFSRKRLMENDIIYRDPIANWRQDKLRESRMDRIIGRVINSIVTAIMISAWSRAIKIQRYVDRRCRETNIRFSRFLPRFPNTLNRSYLSRYHGSETGIFSSSLLSKSSRADMRERSWIDRG